MSSAMEQCLAVFAVAALCQINPLKHTAGYTWHPHTFKDGHVVGACETKQQ